MKLRPPCARALLFLALSLFGAPLCALGRSETLDPKDFPEVVEIQAGDTRCNATVVGERVLLTSRSCLSEKNPLTTIYTAQGTLKGFGIQSRFYDPSTGQLHDLGAIIVFGKLAATPLNITSAPVRPNDRFYAMTHGCSPGSLQGEEVRVGTISEYTYEAAPTFGCPPLGGVPNFNFKMAGPYLRFIFGMGFMPKGAKTVTWIRLDTDETYAFLEGVARAHEVVICGITQSCR